VLCPSMCSVLPVISYIKVLSVVRVLACSIPAPPMLLTVLLIEFFSCLGVWQF
jgi:hypothetical protein